ncbi:amidohydrolase family protein [Lactobacillus sp. DCY120]|uniref:Amidohydrolase family protein n=1 Tax=Bombilactobacillus apium TaxID=2675299 RepID=A0A850R2F2_9LACO|nr:amidohydrolase family protein [Bombilactobacillus apium]NVY96520.1 amidohydrolase family protein [Bombilactobacillus apium]
MSSIIFQKVLQASFFSAQTPEQVDFEPAALIGIDPNGQIAQILTPADPAYTTVLQDAQEKNILQCLPPDEYLLPGFIDLHLHAPQWPQAGIALDKPLNAWLQDYTFPLEAQYQDPDFAQGSYQNLVQTLLANGTTTVLYFGTIDEAANLVLAAQCAQAGQRAFIGQVVMDNPEQTPAYYRNSSAESALESTRHFIDTLRERYGQTGLIQPVLTPRFVPSCSDAVLAGLGQLAQETGLLIQSHCSESDWEDNYVQERFGRSDTEVLKSFGLLTANSIMAHGTMLVDANLATFHQQKAALAHCPISNAYFGNAVLPVRKILQEKITVGLGTDISGGFTPSMYRNIQQAIISARMLEDGVDARQKASERGVKNSRITARQAFYMATVNGAQALHLNTGQIKTGYTADLQVVQDPLAKIASSDPAAIFERLMYQTTAQNIQTVFVKGQVVANHNQ